MKKEMIAAYYKDMQEEMIARKRFPNTSQNKKRIQALKEGLHRLEQFLS